MNATLNVIYGRLLQMRLPLYMIPMGVIARRYILPVIFTSFLPSISVVVRASAWVMHAAKMRCQHVRVIAALILVSYRPNQQRHAYGILLDLAISEWQNCAVSLRKLRLSIMYLLNSMTDVLSMIHVLCAQTCQLTDFTFTD